jgi:hypothetical protein
LMNLSDHPTTITAAGEKRRFAELSSREHGMVPRYW